MHIYRNEEDMYGTVMSNFEKRCTLLQSENSRLRDILADIQMEMYELSNSTTPTSSPRKAVSPNKGKSFIKINVSNGGYLLSNDLNNEHIKLVFQRHFGTMLSRRVEQIVPS